MNEVITVNKIFHSHDEKFTLYLIKNDAQQIIFDKDRGRQNGTTPIKGKQTLKKASHIIRQQEDFIHGMYIYLIDFELHRDGKGANPREHR
ncbi:hypothetical protein [Photorhabdus antumapuensis]|uniref:hypothetical protein n=1 Tax=Photorhabdus antumapuensis TaxID=2862867 RepID=UPI001CECAB4F|nr:hypothetical protein [Photorhabdus antumapuensis]MCA6220814.1 hypothetical protein [Photorhabdus antumapuensis]